MSIMRGLIPLLLLIASLTAYKVVFIYQTWGRIEQISSNGTLLGIASDDGCGYFIKNGTLIYKYCNYHLTPCGPPMMAGVGGNDGKFVLVEYDGFAYVLFFNGTVNKFRVFSFKGKVVALKNFFVSCYVGCAAFTYSGKKLWEFDTIFAGVPSTDGRHIFVPELTNKRISVLSLDGRILSQFELGEEEAMSTSYCDGYLAVGTSTSVKLFKVINDRLQMLWSRDIEGRAWSVAFSPNCKELAVADYMGNTVRIYSTDGEEIAMLRVPGPFSLYWGKYLYVGTELGKLIAFNPS